MVHTTLLNFGGGRWNISILDFIFAPKKKGAPLRATIGHNLQLEEYVESAHGPTSPLPLSLPPPSQIFLLEFVQHVSCEGCTIISLLFKDTHNSHDCH